MKSVLKNTVHLRVSCSNSDIRYSFRRYSISTLDSIYSVPGSINIRFLLVILSAKGCIDSFSVSYILRAKECIDSFSVSLYSMLSTVILRGHYKQNSDFSSLRLCTCGFSLKCFVLFRTLLFIIIVCQSTQNKLLHL